MVDVTMPQLGETVTEGTITAWLKAPGDWVDEDEPLLEVSTEKVDSELPAPASGRVGELLVAEGDTVPVGTLLTRLGASSDPLDETPPTTGPPTADAGPSMEPPTATAVSGDPVLSPPRSTDGAEGFLSPVVRRLVAEHGLDPASIAGRGAEGRVTASDVEHALAERGGHQRSEAAPVDAGGGTEVVPFTASLAAAAHTLVVMEVDYHRVDTVRDEAGLTYLPFIARAVVDALADHPYLNAHVGEDHLVVHDAVHLGVAVDLDFEGLVVPVVRDAGLLRIGPLSDALAEQAAAARARSLRPDDLTGGTFTITNAGRYGTLFTAPIINRPQAAILATDGVRVRPVAVALEGGGHGLGFHPVGNLALSFDHRAVDGAYASSFLDTVRTALETRDWTVELAGRR